MSDRHVIRIALAALFLVGFTSCGSSSTTQWLSGIQVSSSEQAGDLWINMSAQLDTGGFMIAALSIPVVNPKNPTQEYGSISLTQNLCTTNVCSGQTSTLTISVDLSAVTKFQTTTSNMLPNGTPLPVGAAAAASIIGIPIGSGGAKLYVALGSGIALVGMAMPFSALNGVGQYVPGVDIFDAFKIGQATGVVGVFAGNQPNTTGLGLFVDLSAYINGVLPAPSGSTAAHSLAAVNSADLATASQTHAIQFASPHVSHHQRSTLFYQFYLASSSGATLEYK